MTTTIHSNGSKWAGEVPDHIETLLDVLTWHPLDRTFEAFGNFIMPREGAPGTVRFWGNFFNLSHVFSIDTDEPETIEKLSAAIRANQQRPDYLAQPPHFDRDKLTINRKRFSATQGEVELIYDGRRLEQFGDKIEINSRGEWQGQPDRFWEEVARKWLAEDHQKQFSKAA